MHIQSCDADFAFTTLFRSGSLSGTDVFTGALTRVAGENVGTYAITQGTVALSDNYTLSYVGADLTIGKRLVTITRSDEDTSALEARAALVCRLPPGSLTRC